MEMTQEDIEFNRKCNNIFLTITANFFKASVNEKKLNMTDYRVYIYCLNNTLENKKILVEDIAKKMCKSQFTVSKSLRKLKSIKAINKDFTATDKFLDIDILQKIRDDDTYINELIKNNKK